MKIFNFFLLADELMVIVEYCRFGNLKDVLEKHHKNVKNQIIDSSTMQITKSRGPTTARSVTQKDLASWSYQIAQGMQYIASQNIVHGNLSARCILLTDGNLVKISDFGLARAMYKTDAYIYDKEVTSIGKIVHCIQFECVNFWIFIFDLKYFRVNLNTNGLQSNQCKTG